MTANVTTVISLINGFILKVNIQCRRASCQGGTETREPNFDTFFWLPAAVKECWTNSVTNMQTLFKFQSRLDEN